MLVSVSLAGSTQFADVLAFAAPVAERAWDQRKLPHRPRLAAKFGHAIDIGEDQTLRSLDMQKDLPRHRLSTGPLDDLYLIFLHEVAVLHDLIERLDLESGVE